MKTTNQNGFYVPLELEVIEVQMEHGYAFTGNDFGEGGPFDV